jgi:hypothetical protein
MCGFLGSLYGFWFGGNRTNRSWDRTSWFLSGWVCLLIYAREVLYGLGGLYGFCYVRAHHARRAGAIKENRTALHLPVIFVRICGPPKITGSDQGFSLVQLVVEGGAL